MYIAILYSGYCIIVGNKFVYHYVLITSYIIVPVYNKNCYFITMIFYFTLFCKFNVKVDLPNKINKKITIEN